MHDFLRVPILLSHTLNKLPGENQIQRVRQIRNTSNLGDFQPFGSSGSHCESELRHNGIIFKWTDLSSFPKRLEKQDQGDFSSQYIFCNKGARHSESVICRYLSFFHWQSQEQNMSVQNSGLHHTRGKTTFEVLQFFFFCWEQMPILYPAKQLLTSLMLWMVK